MKATFTLFTIFLFVLALGGCSRALEVVTDRPSADYARETIRAIAKGDPAAVESRFADSVKDEHFGENMRAIAAQYLRIVPTEISLVRFASRTNAKNKDAQYTYVFDSLHGDTHVFTEITVVASAGELKISQLRANRADERADAAPFVWTPLHFLCVAIALGNVSIVGTALVRWYRQRRQLSRRWVWLAVILLGVGGAELNWATGQFDSVMPLRFLAFSAAMSRLPDGPWTLELALPLGALAFVFGIPGRFARRKPSPASP